jgi:hypothetical protein
METSVLAQVLTALAQGAGGQAGQRAWTALAALAGRVLGRDSAEAAAIEAVRVSGSPDPASLADLLAGQAEADPGFASGLEEWLADTKLLLASGEGQTANRVTGPVSGTVIQARDVFGGIRFGHPQGRRHDR